LSGHSVFVTEVEFCEELASVDQKSDQVDTGSTAKTQVSDRGQRVTEGLGPGYLSETWEVRGLRKRLKHRLLCVSRAVLLECHKGALKADRLFSC
jgi:hypothetical protein